MSQGTLVATSLLLAVPGLMVFLPLVLPAAVNRWLNIILAAFYILIMVMTMPGSWAFYILLGVIEIGLLGLIVWNAWRWPRRAA